MKLHHFAHSSASYRVRIALALKEIDVDHIRVDMPNLAQQSDSYAKINPQRLVPFLELDNGQVLGQSLAIIDYLDRLKPETPLYPTDSVNRAQAQSMCLMIACDTSPIQAKIVQRYLASEFGLTEQQNNIWLTKWIRRGLEPLEIYLRNRAITSRFVMGNTPSIVDVCIVPQLRNANRFNVEIDDFTSIATLNENCLKHSAFQHAHPENWE